LIKRNSKEIWREVVLKPRPMVVYVLIYGSIHNVTVRIGVIWGGLDGRTSAATVTQYQNKVRQQTTQPHIIPQQQKNISSAFHPTLPVSFPSPRRAPPPPGRSWHRSGRATVSLFSFCPQQQRRHDDVGAARPAAIASSVVGRVGFPRRSSPPKRRQGGMAHNL